MHNSQPSETLSLTHNHDYSSNNESVNSDHIPPPQDSLEARLRLLNDESEETTQPNEVLNSNDENFDSVDEVKESKKHEIRHKKKKKKKERHKHRSRSSKSPSSPYFEKHKKHQRKLSTTDLEARINSLLSEQSEKYSYENNSNSSRSVSRQNSNDKSSIDEVHPKLQKTQSQIDLEDGECSSGEEKKSQSSVYSPSEKLPVESDAQNTTDIGSIQEYSSPTYTTPRELEKRDVSSERLSPKEFRDRPSRRPSFERFNSQERAERTRAHSPHHFHPSDGRLSPYSMERMRRSPSRRFSPPRNGPHFRGGPPPADRHFQDRRRHSPNFEHRRRSPGFENSRYYDRRRSPEFLHRGRRTPPRFGYNNGPRHHFNRSPPGREFRRSISPDHHRKSPGRFNRRSPERFPPSHNQNQYHRPGSPHHPDYRRRRSPEFLHRGERSRHSPGRRDREFIHKRSVSPGDDRRPRHRELPAEFRERWSQYENRRSPSKPRYVK